MKKANHSNKPEVIISADGTRGFFQRGKAIAKLSDQKKSISRKTIIHFDSAKEMLAILTKPRRQVMQIIRECPASITNISVLTHRNRAAVAKDIKLLEHYGLVKITQEVNPGHGMHKIVRPISKLPIHLEAFI